MLSLDTNIVKEKAIDFNADSSSALFPQSGLSFIEQLQISASKPCTKTNSPYLIGVNHETKNAILTKSACKCWACETCAARNAKRWIATIIHGVKILDGAWSFLTVTAHRKKRGGASVQNIRQGWKKLYNRILSSTLRGENEISYAKVWEQQEDGTFHLHCLLSECFGSRWAKDNAAGCGLGFMADWHEVDNAGKVAGYMAKYTLKNANISRGGIVWPKGLRRIETSQNWPKLPDLRDKSGIDWEIYFDRDEQIKKAGGLYWLGYDVTDMVKIPKEE